MRFPIKLNRSCLPACFWKYLPCQCDPRKLLAPEAPGVDFDACVSAIRVGATWKSTSRHRQMTSNTEVKEIAASMDRPTILEIGVSSGVNALDLLRMLGDSYGRYFVTDLCLEIGFQATGKVFYLYAPVDDEKCIMRVTDRLLVYKDTERAVFPLGKVAARLLACAPKVDRSALQCASLVHPELRHEASRDGRIVLAEYDIRSAWARGPVDIVRIANVLNRTYFDEADISRALLNVNQAVRLNGCIVLVDNREREKVSILRKKSSGLWSLEKEINGGSEVAGLALRAMNSEQVAHS